MLHHHHNLHPHSAKHLAAKVVTDLYQCHILYGRPASSDVDDYQGELVELLVGEYVDSYEFGFKRDDRRVLTWRYSVGPDGGLHGDAGAGAIVARVDVAGATYFNFLSYSTKWWLLSDSQRAQIKAGLPVKRTGGSLPADGNGYWQVDHGYSAGGVRVERSTFRPW